MISKKKHFGPFLVCFLHISSKKKFPNLPNVPCHALDMGFYHHAKTWNKTLNAQIEGRKDGRTDPISQDLSRYRWESNYVKNSTGHSIMSIFLFTLQFLGKITFVKITLFYKFLDICLWKESTCCRDNDQ